MKKRLILILATFAISSLGIQARQPQRGYRGFIEWSNDLRSENWTGWGRQTLWYSGLSTSHGMQFNPWLFVGAGIEYEYCKEHSMHICAPFIQGRTDLKFGKFTPFADIRLGYDLTSEGRIFFSPNIGYRFNWGRKVGINVGVGLSLVNYRTDIFDIATDPDGYVTVVQTGKSYSWNRTLFSFRLGFDF